MAKVADSHTCMDFKTSGVAKLGHTRVRALATGGCAPSVQVLLKITSAECTVINRELGAKVHKGVEIELRSISTYIFRITRSVCSPDLDVCMFAISTSLTSRCARAGS